ncbi:MAG: hypothetical protein O2839_03485 [Cyanobacteria bacterium]|nr:hypothetical protein [Cyanobacteriota bacterium]MDA1246756.1 hypothetical protein [Cyanobacteriota bacterium]
MELEAVTPEPNWQPSVTSVFLWHQQQERQGALEQELVKTREELQAMQALLEDLPGIFEDKFRQRLQPMLDQQQRLLSDNAMLRQHLLMPKQELSQPRRRQALLHAFGLGSNRAA